MNAYELADELQEMDSKMHSINLFKSANMLRQQADRIAKLEKAKTLTDEEILAIFNPKFDVEILDSEVIAFGKALLKKINE